MFAKRYYILLSMSILQFNFILFLNIINTHGQNDQNKEPIETVKVKANKKVIKLIKTWDKNIWFFTSKDNPIRSLDNLKNNEIACWGAEHWNRYFAFLDAAGIKYEEKSLNILGTGNPIFSGMSNPPRLYFTWSNYASHLKGAVKVEFVEGISIKSKPKDTYMTQTLKDVQVTLSSVERKVGEYEWKKYGYILKANENSDIVVATVQIKAPEHKMQFIATPVLLRDIDDNIYESGWDQITIKVISMRLKEGMANYDIVFGVPKGVKLKTFQLDSLIFNIENFVKKENK